MAQDSDVKLLLGQVKVEALDLCLDSQDRRKNNTQHRRALVHDFDDGLTLNWNRDYPGGVTIKGNTNVDGNLSVRNGLFRAQIQKLDGWEFLGNPPAIHLVAEDLVLHNRELQDSKRNVALSHTDNDTLTINRNKGYVGGVKIEGRIEATETLEIKESIHIGSTKPYGNHLRITNDTIEVTTKQLGFPGHQPSLTLDLVAEIRELRKEINALKQKVANLEQS
jgi:hypothetical protein